MAAPLPNGAAPEIGSLAVRLPTFWSAAPELWFAQAEASFKNWNPKITSDQTKYHYLLQALPQDVLMEFEQAVTDNGPERYVGLKWALIKGL